jgi:hypothetical protein
MDISALIVISKVWRVEMGLRHYLFNKESKKLTIDENKKFMEIAAIDAFMDSKNEAELEAEQLSLFDKERD